MLTIRKAQMQVLSTYTKLNFEDRMIRHLHGRFPEEVKELNGATPGDDKLRALIRLGIKKAASYGITSERDTGRFIELLLKAAPDFDQQPDSKWALTILRDESLSAKGKVELLHAQFAVRAAETADARAP